MESVKGERALILGGGGITGIAWEIGVIAGLYEAGVELRNADLIAGTSAGSNVGAQITTDRSLADLLAAQIAIGENAPRREINFDPAKLQAAFNSVMQAGPMDPQSIRARIGALALAAPTPPESEWLAAIGVGLPEHEWPDRPLVVTAIDTETGEWKTFDRDSGVSLVAAVAASCAVPGVFPPVTLDGRRYMDGGMRTLTNADLARGYSRVLILDPINLLSGAPSPFGGLAEEIAVLQQQGSRVLVIAPDDASRAAIGDNSLDQARRVPAARAGKEQGLLLVASVGEFWS